MGQRTPFGTYTNEPSVNTAELRAAKKLSLYGTTEPRYCCTSSGYSRIASEMAQKITPDRKSTRLNSSHSQISYAVFCLKKKNRLGSRPWSSDWTSAPALDVPPCALQRQ